MFVKLLKISFAALFLASTISLSTFGEDVGTLPYKSQEVSETDGVPVLIKHLPDWENRRDVTTFVRNSDELKSALGERPILSLIEFAPGMEAVTAQYEAGKLLIVEYTSPDESSAADVKITAAIAANDDGHTFYRRIGNYNVLVFDATNSSAANALIDQVKYEKQIHWLGKNPFAISAERAFVITTADIFLSTLLVIVGGIVLSIFGGIIIGYVFYYYRDGKRSKLTAYTDAGGMTRLNLDGFTPDIAPDRLLGD
jgi:hypothetical protein